MSPGEKWKRSIVFDVVFDFGRDISQEIRDEWTLASEIVCKIVEHWCSDGLVACWCLERLFTKEIFVLICFGIKTTARDTKTVHGIMLGILSRLTITGNTLTVGNINWAGEKL